MKFLVGNDLKFVIGDVHTRRAGPLCSHRRPPSGPASRTVIASVVFLDSSPQYASNTVVTALTRMI